MKGVNKSFTVDDTRRERIFTVQEHCVVSSYIHTRYSLLFFLENIPHCVYTLLRFDPRSCLRASLFSSLLYREKYQVLRYLECKHGRHSATPYSRYKRRHLLLFHVPLTPVPWNFLLPSRAELLAEPVYVAVASSGSQARDNKYPIVYVSERARSCEENSAGTGRHVDRSRYSAMLAELSSKLLFLPANIKEKWLMHSISRRA